MPPMYLLSWFLKPRKPPPPPSPMVGRNSSLRNCPDPDCHAMSGDIQYGLDSPTCIVLVPHRVKYASTLRRDALMVVRLTRSRYMRAPCRPAMQRPGSLFQRRRWRRALSVLLWTACVACLCGGRAAEMTCRACPDGSYLNQTSVSCAECPAHSRVPRPANASSVLACECEAAHTPSATTCVLCELASYKGALGNVSCTLCPANTNTTACGGVALTECFCAPGFFLEGDSTLAACAPCPAGSFKGHVGNGTCAACPAYTFCPLQSTTPVPCVGNSSRLATARGSNMLDCQCQPAACPADTFCRCSRPPPCRAWGTARGWQPLTAVICWTVSASPGSTLTTPCSPRHDCTLHVRMQNWRPWPPPGRVFLDGDWFDIVLPILRHGQRQQILCKVHKYSEDHQELQRE